MKTLYLLISLNLTVSISFCQTGVEENKSFTTLFKNKKIATLFKQDKICTIINFTDTLKEEFLHFNISDSVLPVSYVIGILRELVRDSCIKENIDLSGINWKTDINDQIETANKNTQQQKNAHIRIYKVHQLGNIQSYIVGNENHSILFDKVRFGTILYLFVQKRKENEVLVFGARIIYN